MPIRKTRPRKRPARKGSVSSAANPLWGGRFASGPAEIMQAINASIDVDRGLWSEDIEASLAHAAMLVRQGIIRQADGRKIARGLKRIRKEIEEGRFEFRADLEDIHMNVEARLKTLIGAAAGRLHTARSRNDQVATDFRLWVRGAIDRLDDRLNRLIAALLDRAEEHAATVMPGYTHLQPAQAVTFGHHLMAYVEMFGRDRGRLMDARARLDECPLGAAALAGTSFPIDRAMTAKALGFAQPMRNSIDAVSDRDFALETLAAGAILAVHLSRLAEELVLWTSPGFGFVALGDAFTTGSSIMPQKRNPDAAELIRAKSGRAIAGLTQLLVVLKGLPLTYGKDMQEDKAPTFAALADLQLSLDAMTGMIRNLKADAKAMRAATAAGFLTATDLADWLVRVLDLPFRRAHHAAGRLVRLAEAKGCGLADLGLPDFRRVVPGIGPAVYKVLDIDRSVASRRGLGGTAPNRVRQAIAAARKRSMKR